MQCNYNVDPIGLQSGSSGFVHVVPVQKQICRTPLPYFSTTFDDKVASRRSHRARALWGHRSTTDETTTRIAIKCLSSAFSGHGRHGQMAFHCRPDNVN